MVSEFFNIQLWGAGSKILRRLARMKSGKKEREELDQTGGQIFEHSSITQITTVHVWRQNS
jgi:hypothetical protein